MTTTLSVGDRATITLTGTITRVDEQGKFQLTHNQEGAKPFYVDPHAGQGIVLTEHTPRPFKVGDIVSNPNRSVSYLLASTGCVNLRSGHTWWQDVEFFNSQSDYWHRAGTLADLVIV